MDKELRHYLKILQDSKETYQPTKDALLNEVEEKITKLFKSTPQSEHKSIEGLRREFEEKIEQLDKNGGFISMLTMQTPNWESIWNFFLPHLNSRNLLERFMKWFNDNNDPEYRLTKEDLDEFIESELGK